jgi:DNA repair ATPase RecN
MSARNLSRCWARSPHLFALSLLGGSLLFTTSPFRAAHAQSPPSVAECNQFADVVNRNQEILAAFESEINTFSDNASEAETLEDIRSAATQYVEAVDAVTENLSILSTDLEALAFSDDRLSTYRTDYVAVVAGFNDALSIVSEAMSRVATAESETALAENLEVVQTDTTAAADQISDLADDESDIIGGVNDYCGAS